MFDDKSRFFDEADKPAELRAETGWETTWVWARMVPSKRLSAQPDVGVEIPSIPCRKQVGEFDCYPLVFECKKPSSAHHPRVVILLSAIC